MRLLSKFAVPALLALVCVSSPSPAQVPFIPGSPGSPSPVPQGVPELLPPTALPPTVAPPLPVALPIRPLTVREFAASFRPLPGHYEVLLIHPKTCVPVKVCFTLPPGCIRKVRVNGHKIEFVYKCQRDVVIRFLHRGGVWVRG